MAQVSIIICTCNRVPYLTPTLDAVGALDVSEGLSAELIVVDNGSTDRTAEVVRSARLPNMTVRYVCEEAPGLSNARNAGIARARGDILLWTDDDARPPQDWIGAMCEPILSGQADGVCGKVRTAPHLERPWMARSHYDRMSDTQFMPDDFGVMIGANMGFHRRVLEKVSAFDPELGAGTGRTAEETLFSFQMIEAGFRIAALPVTVEHHFEPERLQRRVWLRVGKAYGRGEAYLRHHWEHKPVRFAFGQMLLWKAALAVFRKVRPPVDMDAEGCDRREIRLAQNVSYFQSYLQERWQPHKYDRHGLVKKSMPPLPMPNHGGQRNKTLKVAIIMPLAEQRGGGELMLWHLMQQGRDQGIEWLVIFQEDGPMVARVQGLGVKCRVIPSGRLRELHRFPVSVAHIAALVKREKADAVFSWMAKPHLYGGPAARLAGVPALWYQLGMPAPESRLDSLATRLPAEGIFVCSQTAAEAQERMRPVRPVRVVHPGAELERFDPAVLPTPAEARANLGLPPNGPLIGIVGRMQHWKGMHVLVEAMPRVLQSHPDAHAVVVGGVHPPEPDYPDFLAGRIAALGLADRVTLAGLQRNIPEWMQALDIFVHASNREPFGIVIIEAMALGKPVVAGDQAGPTEIITDGVHGLLTPFGNADALAGALLRYLDDPAEAARIGERGRARAQEFSSAQYAANFIAALRDLMS